MPADTQAIDWPGIRAASAMFGVRGAARAAAADLPPEERNRFVERVMKRASREGWEREKSAVLSAAVSAAGGKMSAPAGAPGKPMSAPVRTGAEIVADQLGEDNRESKLDLSSALRSVAKHVRNLSAEAPADVLADAANVKAIAGSLALVHSWEAKAGNSVPTITLNVGFLLDCQALGEPEHPIRDVSAEVVREGEETA